MNIISTEKAPGAIGPYSQGYEVNGFIFTSGQIPIHPQDGSIVSGGIEAQTEQSCKNVGAILSSAGSGFNQVYAKYFISKPARSCVAVKELPKGVLCEIEAIAVK